MEDLYFSMQKNGTIGKYDIVKLIGEFDLNEVNFFEKKLLSLIGREGGDWQACLLVLDISELEYLDSSAIGAFVRLYREIVEKGKGKLFFFKPKEFIEELFQISNLKNFLSVVHTKKELEEKCL